MTKWMQLPSTRRPSSRSKDNEKYTTVHEGKKAGQLQGGIGSFKCLGGWLKSWEGDQSNGLFEKVGEKGGVESVLGGGAT